MDLNYYLSLQWLFLSSPSSPSQILTLDVLLEGPSVPVISSQMQAEMVSFLASALSVPVSSVRATLETISVSADSEGCVAGGKVQSSVQEPSSVIVPVTSPPACSGRSCEHHLPRLQASSVTGTGTGSSAADIGTDATVPVPQQPWRAAPLAVPSPCAPTLIQPGPQPSASPNAPPAPIHVVASGGRDCLTCGAVDEPCATLRYAVNVLANYLTPLNVIVPIALGRGAYGPDNCGANATRPVNVTGAGSEATLIDCQGTERALAASDSLWLSGITIRGGFVNVSAVVPGSAPAYSSFAAGGGGGVSIVWPTSLCGACAEVVDVVFVNNSMIGIVGASGAGVRNAAASLGGGGLFVAGGGNNSAVALLNCVFLRNTVSVVDNTGTSAACGGGVCVLVGLASAPVGADSTNTTSSAAVRMLNVSASHNNINCTVTCGQCFEGECAAMCGWVTTAQNGRSVGHDGQTCVGEPSTPRWRWWWWHIHLCRWRSWWCV